MAEERRWFPTGVDGYASQGVIDALMAAAKKSNDTEAPPVPPAPIAPPRPQGMPLAGRKVRPKPMRPATKDLSNNTPRYFFVPPWAPKIDAPQMRRIDPYFREDLI